MNCARDRNVVWASLVWLITYVWCTSVVADSIAMVPVDGRLEAVNDRGGIIGPCPLQHTHVHVEVSGPFSFVEIKQTYENPYDAKIEAVYTFPMGHRAAVHSMRMVVGDRVVDAEIREREEARALYEEARFNNRVASLLEQERPNIFTQSVANIEPGAQIEIEISYIEVLESREGVYSWTFPMVVGPRYIPGGSTASRAIVPAELDLRHGPVRVSPGVIDVALDDSARPAARGRIHALLTAAVPIHEPPDTWWGMVDGAPRPPEVLYRFIMVDCDGGLEDGFVHADGTGRINDRWFFTDLDVLEGMGTGFAQNTNQVPDAGRVTPMPTRPPVRAGHDISLSVDIDTGGPALLDIESELHAVDVRNQKVGERGRVRRAIISLTNQSEIPNRDFALRWRQSAPSIECGVLAHADDDLGRFFTLVVQPPDRVEPASIRPRELIFVLDSSGSMGGEPIEQAKRVIVRALETMRAGDTFNVITFAGSTDVLWPAPKPNNDDTRREAMNFINLQSGSGGTEMMKAIRAALVPGWEDQAAHPHRIVMFLTDGYVGNDQAILNEVQKHARTTRVFSFGVGNAPNRYLLDGMARAARGAADYVTLEGNPAPIIKRFTRRIEAPVLTDISLQFSDHLGVHDIAPLNNHGLHDDLYDVAPLIVHGQYVHGGAGTVRIAGKTGAGEFAQTIDISLPEIEPRHRSVATMWARERIEMLTNRDLNGLQLGQMHTMAKQRITNLGLRFGLVTQFTSFVAVDKLRQTIDGEPVLIDVPIELPDGARFEGFFADDGRPVGRARGGLLTAADLLNAAATGGRGTGGGGGGTGGGGFGRGGGGGGGIGGGGGGGTVFGDPGDEADQIPIDELADELIDVIVNLVEREEDVDTWDVVGGDRAFIRHYKGVLIIRAPDYIHRAVEDLLQDLRHNRTEAMLMAQSPDELTDAVIELLSEGRVAPATRLATWVELHHPEFPISDIVATFVERLPLDEAAMQQALDHLRAEIDSAVSAASVAARRVQLIRARIDQRLWEYALDESMPPTFDPASAGSRPDCADWVEGGMRVAVRLETTAERALQALRAAEFRIESVSHADRLVIGVLPLGRLDDLALQQSVRQVEPVVLRSGGDDRKSPGRRH